MSTLVQDAPTFTPADAAALAADHFGVQGTAATLPSERDQNFLLTTTDGARTVLKLANAGEEEATLALQNAALAHLAAATDPRLRAGIPTLLPNRTGTTMGRVIGPDGAGHFVRLLSYVPGKPLALAKPHSPELLRDLGNFLGRMDRALADFHHPGARRELDWDLQRAARVLEESLPLLPGERRGQIEAILDHFLERTAPLLPTLRRSIIHNDANDYNVLVRLDDWRLQVSGLIDFGDMVQSYTVGELAVAGAYAMLDKPDPLAAAGHLAAGYHAAHPLTEDEVAALYDLMRMRLATSVCMAARQQQAAPDNHYLGISQGPVARLLERLETIQPALAHYTLRSACGFDPHPQQEQILQWLREAKPASVLDVDVSRPGAAAVLDLGVGSALLPTPESHLDTAALDTRIQAEIRAAGAQAGVGRYNEARLIYSGAQFQDLGEFLAERRTIHLGLDLFVPAGSPVYAPLDGVVHAVQENPDPQDYGPTVILAHATGDGVPFYTLYGHLGRECLTALKPGQTVARGQAFATVGAAAVNGGWPPHLHLQIILDLLGQEGTFPGVGRPGQAAVMTALCPDPNMLVGVPADAFPAPGRSQAEILDLRRAHLGRNLSVSYRAPLKIERGWRQFLYDEQGQAHLDVVNNVCHVGHGHPHVVRAGQAQMAVLNTNTRYLHDNIVDYAQTLLAKFPRPLDVVFFVCSGSEANELALRLARTYTSRRDILMLDAAYHGNTQALVDISPYKHNGPGGQGAPDWAHMVTMPDPYRGVYKGMDRAAGAAYAAHVAETLQAVDAQGRGVAAFIAESVLGCGGQVVLPEGYLADAFAHVRQAGGICIADEVQVGFGRVGSHFWGFETQGVTPDIVTMGKPMGNGHPLGAVVTTSAIAEAFANGMEYFNTFGGNPVSCAIGKAVLEVIDSQGLQANALAAGNRLLTGLAELQARHPLVGDVRGLGLFVGAELVLDRETLEPAPRHASYIANRMREHGILISTDGPLHNVLKMKPPVVFTEQDADRLVTTLDTILQEECLQV